MKVTCILTVIGNFGVVIIGLKKGLKNLETTKRVETIQTISLLRHKESWQHEETCSNTNFSQRPSTYTDVKNTHNPAPVLENDAHKLLWDFNI